MTIRDRILDDVSRETSDRLNVFHDRLLHWTTSINLIAPSTVPHAWERHILDSAQVFDFIPPDASRHIDIGSGGGLPGLVIAIIAKEKQPGLASTLIESDQRKATFLRSVIRELDLQADVRCARIEAVADVTGDVVTARALAPLDQLLGFVAPLMAPGGVALLQKGRQAEAEIDLARQSWSFDLVSHVSRTEADARILQIKDIRRASS